MRLRGEAKASTDSPSLWTTPTLTALPWLTHGVTSRRGGVSRAPWNSLNLGLHVGDDALHVCENRARTAQLLGFGLSQMVCAEQVHGNRAAVVGAAERGRGATSLTEAIPGADALITDSPGLLLALFYADCLPIFFADPDHRVIAIAHAGWRGLVGGVLENTLSVMAERFGTDPAAVRAAIGPGIGACCFNVGPEVARQFPGKFVTPNSGTTPSRVDLSGAAYQRLHDAGVQAENLAVCTDCTSCHPDRYFSHRRDRGQTGRMGALIGLRSER